MGMKKYFPWIALISLLLILGLGFFFGGPVLVRAIASSALSSAGFKDAAIGPIYFIPGGVVIEHVLLDKDGFSEIKAIQVRASPIDAIFRRKVNSISVKSIFLLGEMDEKGKVNIVGYTPSTSASSDRALPFDNISLDGVTIDLDTPAGVVTAEAKVNVDNKDNALEFQISSWAKQSQLTYALSLTGRRSTEGFLTLNGDLQDMRIHIDPYSVTRMAGWFELKQSKDVKLALTGQLDSGAIKIRDIGLNDLSIILDQKDGLPHALAQAKHPSDPQAVISIDMTGTQDLSSASVEITASAPNIHTLLSFINPPEQAWLQKTMQANIKISVPVMKLPLSEVVGSWSFSGNQSPILTGDFTYDVQKKQLSGVLAQTSLDVQSLARFLDLAGNFNVSPEKGTIAAGGQFRADLSQKPLVIAGPGEISVKNAQASWNGFAFEDVDTLMKVERWLPFETGKKQSLSVKKVVSGQTLENVSATYNLLPLQVNTASADMAGGKVLVSPFMLKDKSSATDIKLTLDRLSIPTLIDKSDENGLTTSGTVSGTFPVRLQNGKISVQSGAILGDGPGYIKYMPANYPKALEGESPQMDTVRKALSDFNFTSLEVSIDGPLAGDMKTTLKASGTNPTFGDRPINLNLNLEGALAPALLQTLQPGKLADTIRKDFEKDKTP